MDYKGVVNLHQEIPAAPGVYRLHVGAKLYVGSSFDLRKRVGDHRLRLEKRDHPNGLLQEEFDRGGNLWVEVVEVLWRKPGEGDDGLRRRLRLHEQWELDRVFGERDCCNQSGSSGFNTCISEAMREKWADPEFRERMLEKLRGVHGRPVSAETREKMSSAQRGGKNPRARGCVLRLPCGDEVGFACVSDAARSIGVRQQTLDLWLRGVVPWPGSGNRMPRSADGKRLLGLTGWYVG